MTREVSAQNGLVIATGGGCVLREENVRALRMNGRLFWIDRPLEQLIPTDDRPTADSTEKMHALYAVREPIYRKTADAVIASDGIAEHVTTAVLKRFQEEIYI